jgi:hypothetical protein
MPQPARSENVTQINNQGYLSPNREIWLRRKKLIIKKILWCPWSLFNLKRKFPGQFPMYKSTQSCLQFILSTVHKQYFIDAVTCYSYLRKQAQLNSLISSVFLDLIFMSNTQCSILNQDSFNRINYMWCSRPLPQFVFLLLASSWVPWNWTRHDQSLSAIKHNQRSVSPPKEYTDNILNSRARWCTRNTTLVQIIFHFSCSQLSAALPF